MIEVPQRLLQAIPHSLGVSLGPTGQTEVKVYFTNYPKSISLLQSTSLVFVRTISK